MWMVRGDGGNLFDAFRERSVVAIGWHQLAAAAKPGVPRQDLVSRFLSAEPQAKRGTALSGASQVWRFVNEIQVGDWVVSYSPQNRVYLIGKIDGLVEHHPEWDAEGMSLARHVMWQPGELQRDSLGAPSKNSLGSTLTVFQVPNSAAEEVLAVMRGTSPATAQLEQASASADPLEDVESQGIELIKDRVNELDWSDMQQLVAGILRAMGYKTQVSPAGPDRGKDIVASPDGFGFEHPRIVVEVKHRKGQMGSPEIRGFLGGRHKDDRGLYVSTNGFTKDAIYEAERAPIPLALWTLDHVVRALIEHYDATDAETKRLVPLKRLYWPA
ncbi:restriction endonuclease [Stenotrophomonas sp. 278]|uniref:restriction endonuclease n=1 Tax=Stenotrophomonas sp. 278 TaxID=2479851 RepID=UPI0021AD7DD1|nr:restriction endonuclease [Stenotrophomonas sp. 278]